MTDLRRHVPPLTLTWDEESPGRLWRTVDGTLVFADVSGFTAMTEKLSRRGRIGAEEIVETLNRVFGPMLRIAASRGGELLKFGGDALLFLFRGEDHTEQACDAAVEMRTALRQAAAVPTSVGRLSLSMSVGVHAGDIHLFLVGQPTRELLILGPGATATTLAEKAAEAGEIVVSPATAALLASSAVRPRPDGALLLRRRVPRSEPAGALAAAHAGPERLGTLFPHALGEYLAPAVPDPEHRVACIAFIRFSGTDELLARSGPDAVADALQRTVSVVEEALGPEEVTLLATDLDSDGGKFFLGSGIPTAFEDNEGRMLRALRAIADAGSPLPLQLGVNRGHVFAAEVGVEERGAYTGMGDTTNTAARIMSKAPPGRIYAHPAVLEHSRTLFAVEPAGPFPMKGKAVPLLVYDVGEELGTREEAGARAGLPLLGREAELAALRAALSAALAGAGGVVSLTAATGMGKSRVVREALSGWPGAHALVVRAEPYGAASAYRVFRDPLRTILGLKRDAPDVMGRTLLSALRSDAPDLLPMAPLLADVVQVDVPSTPEVDALDPQFRPDRLADTVVRLLERILPGPLILVAEEAHWADGASARLLDRLAGATTGRPWAVVAVRRDTAGGFAPQSGARVELGPLPADVIEQLVIAATEATPLRPQEIAAIVDRAEGNPLYVEEVTRVARGAGSLDVLPESVGAALTAQIDLLTPRSRRILRCCAVLGRSFRLEVLRRTLRADGTVVTPADVDVLSAFVRPDGPHRLRFRNSLIRDAAYEGLAYKVRAQLHRTAGETLEAMSTDLDADSPTLALHFWRAGDAPRTWRYAQRAAELARNAYANVDAARYYERAIEASRGVEEVSDADRAALWTLIGELRELAGELDGSIAAYRRAAGLVADPVARAEILGRRAQVHQRAGAPRTALRVVANARRLLAAEQGPRADAATVRLDILMARVRLGQERSQEARRWALQAVRTARAAHARDHLATALMMLDHADWQLGVPIEGEHIREALAIYVDSGDLVGQKRARENLGVLAFGAGRWGEALDWYRASREAAVRAGMDFGAAETELNIAEILILRGQLDEAEAILASTLRVLRASGIAFHVAFGETLWARIHLARGELVEAEDLAARAEVEYTALGSAQSAIEALLVRAEVAVRRGGPQEALAMLGTAQDAGAALQPQVQRVRAEALRALGRPGEALEAVEQGLQAAREGQLPYDEARLLEARASLGSGTGGVDATGAAAADAARARQILAGMGVAP